MVVGQEIPIFYWSIMINYKTCLLPLELSGHKLNTKNSIHQRTINYLETKGQLMEHLLGAESPPLSAFLNQKRRTEQTAGRVWTSWITNHLPLKAPWKGDARIWGKNPANFAPSFARESLVGAGQSTPRQQFQISDFPQDSRQAVNWLPHPHLAINEGR